MSRQGGEIMDYIINEEERENIIELLEFAQYYVIAEELKSKQPIELVAEGGIDEACKQFGKWGCYKDSNDKYKIYIQKIK